MTHSFLRRALSLSGALSCLFTNVEAMRLNAEVQLPKWNKKSLRPPHTPKMGETT